MVALQTRNDLETQSEMTSEEKDADLVQRLEELLIDNQGHFDVDCLRENFQHADIEKSGKIGKNEVFWYILRSLSIYQKRTREFWEICVNMRKKGNLELLRYSMYNERILNNFEAF